MNTIVFHCGALGDSILIWPLLRALAEEQPVMLVSAAEKGKLAARWIEGVKAVDGEAPAFACLHAVPGAAIATSVRQLLAGADRVISFISSGRDGWAANAAALCGRGRVVCVSARPPVGSSEHIVRFHQRMLTEKGLSFEPAVGSVRFHPKGPVLIHPGSGGRDKCWPAERFDQLITVLRQRGHRIVITLGEVELERLDTHWTERWRRSCHIVEPPDFIGLSDTVAQAALFIGVDSGPTHLAAAMGVPTVAMFGPTDPRNWAPVGPAVTVLRPPQPRAMDWLGVDAVLETIHHAIPRAPVAYEPQSAMMGGFMAARE